MTENTFEFLEDCFLITMLPLLLILNLFGSENQ